MPAALPVQVAHQQPQESQPKRIKGKVVDPSIVQDPTWFPLRSRPVSRSAHPNVRVSTPSPAKRITKNLERIVPGQDGVPAPRKVVAGGTLVPTIQPKPIVAQPPRMKDAAIANMQYLDIDQGMISSYVWCLMEDSKGNLWIGTNDGISRYDGNTFVHYTMQEGLGSNRTRCMLEDSRGHLWFGSDGGGVSRYDGVCFTRFTVEDGLSDNHIFAMLEDAEGQLWFGTRSGEVNLLEIAKGASTFTHFRIQHGKTSYPIWTMMQDRDSALWFGTMGGGVFRYNGEDFTKYGIKDGLSSDEIWSIFEDSRGSVWFGTNGNGACLLRENEDGVRTFTHYSNSNGLMGGTIWCILEDDQQNIWLGSEGSGVSRFQQTASDGSGFFTNYSISEGLSSDRIQSMMIGSQGGLWLGTRGGGITRFDASSFMHFTKQSGLSDNTIWSLIEDRNGHLWFGTRSGGVNVYDGATFTHFTTREGLSSNEVTCIIEDVDGHLWFGTQGGGVTVLSGNKLIHLTTDHGLSSNEVQTMFEDKKGDIWIGTEGGGLNRYDPSKGIDAGIFTHFTTVEGLASNTVRAIYQDDESDIWIGTQGGGVNRFRSDGSYAGGMISRYHSGHGLSHNRVWAIHADTYGYLWFGTQGGGLSRFDGSTFTNFNTTHGLSHDWVWSIVEDDKQNIWTSTEKGICVLVPVASRSETQGSSSEEYQFFTFGKADGLIRLDFSQNACLDRLNRIWWGSIEGLTMLDLNQFDLPSTIPEMRMSTIEIGQEYIDYRNLGDSLYRTASSVGKTIYENLDSISPFQNYPVTLDLPHKLNHLTFQFSAIDWNAPHKLQYAYLMEGSDEAWSPVSSETSVTYRNLAPGQYTFTVKAIGAAQIWSEPISYEFSIRPPWWLSWWAKAIYGVGCISLVVGFVRFRTADLTRRQRELEQTVADRTAEVVAQTAEVMAQRNRSEELLLNILPPEVATELKETGHTEPVRFEEVSILFADFKEFTNIVASIPGKKLVQELDEIFQHFDDIIDEVGLEKIQTIGDAYLAAAGLPRQMPDHAKKCVEAGKKMIAYLDHRNGDSSIKWKLRIGIHSGPVTAGVVGKKKFSYDIFGDTVNIAARVESSSKEGQINVSAYTYDLIRDSYECEYRGKINAKGKGDLDMYFVKQAKMTVLKDGTND